MTQDAVIQLVKRYVGHIRKAGIPVERAFLFGSHTKGTSHKWSDIDACIISSVFGKDRQAERLSLMELTDKETDRIEPHPYSPEDFSSKFDPLANEIRKTGIQVA